MSVEPNLPGRPYFGRIDSIRGIGSLMVAAHHFSRYPLNGIPLLPHMAPWPEASTGANLLGSALILPIIAHPALLAFFVISGFVLRVALDYGPTRVGPASLKFLLNRLFRIFPIVCVGVLTVAPTSVWDFARQALLLDIHKNLHFWSLQVEVLMVPMILALFFLERRFGPKFPPIAVAVTTGLVFVPQWAGWPPLSVHVFAFALGMAMPTSGRLFALRQSRRAILGWYAGAAAVALFAGPLLGMYSVFTILLEGYAAAIVLSIVAYRPDAPLMSHLDAGWLRRIGAAAGSIYVLHMAFVYPGLAIAARIVPPEWSAASPVAVGISVLFVWLAVLIPLMILVSRLVEVPGVALGRRVVIRLGLNRRTEAKPTETVSANRIAA